MLDEGQCELPFAEPGPEPTLAVVRSHSLFADLQPHVVEAFWAYHSENPHVYELFKRYAHDLRRAGRNHYGAKAVMERIRWHYSVETLGDDFKLNNNYTSCYARLLIMQDSRFASFFQTRRTPGSVHLFPGGGLYGARGA